LGKQSLRYAYTPTVMIIMENSAMPHPMMIATGGR